MEADNTQNEDMSHVRFNPLADYVLQTEYKPKRVKKKIGDTTLADDVRLSLWGMSDDSEIGYKDEYGNFKFSQVLESATNRNRILSMSGKAQSLFIWILYEIDYRSDTVEIKLKKVNSKGLKISANSLDNSIKELEKNQIIKRIGTPKAKDYWLFHINPQVIWKGDAKNFYRDVLSAHPEYKPKLIVKKVKRSYKKKPRPKGS